MVILVTKDQDENQIKAFYQDMSGYEKRYNNPSSPANIPKDQISLEKYIYIKHHDGSNYEDLLIAPGLEIWNEHNDFECTISGQASAGETNEPKGSILDEAVDTLKKMGLSNEQIAFGIAEIKNKSGADNRASYQMNLKAVGDRIERAWNKAEAFRDVLVDYPISGDYKIKFIDIVHAIWQGNVNTERISSVLNSIKETHAGDRVNKKSFDDTYDRMLKLHEKPSQRNDSRSGTLRRDGSDYRKVYRVEDLPPSIVPFVIRLF